METETARVLAGAAKCEMADHLRVAAREAGEYIERYALAYVSGRTGRPHPPLTMHPLMRKMARELVADEGVYVVGRHRR